MREGRREAKKKGKAVCEEDRSSPQEYPLSSGHSLTPLPLAHLGHGHCCGQVAWPSWPAASWRTRRIGLFIPKPVLDVGGNRKRRGHETCPPCGQLPVSTPCLWEPMATSRGSPDTLDILVALRTPFP